jgi:hypothetical protein
MLLRKYSENIEVVDPMLRNNKELSDIVGDIEKAWSLAKDHMLEDEKLMHLQVLSNAIENSCSKYKQFREMVENCESDIFMTIPFLAVLRGLINEEENGVCKRFLPSIIKDGDENNKKYLELKSEFLKLRTKVCGNTEFIIRTNTSSSHSRQRSNSRDASASLPNGSKATVASSIQGLTLPSIPPSP